MRFCHYDAATALGLVAFMARVMGFKNLSIQNLYAPGLQSPIDFYKEVLPVTSVARIGLGYFSSTAFEALAESFSWWSDNVPLFQIVANEHFSPDDAEAVESVATVRLSAAHVTLGQFQAFWSALSLRRKRGYEFLTYLIQVGKLELKIALSNSGGIVHHKFAIFEDQHGAKIATHGSLNFSAAALLKNVETMHTVRTWCADEYAKEIADYYESLFCNLWDDKQPEVNVIAGDEIACVLKTVVPARTKVDFKSNQDCGYANNSHDRRGAEEIAEQWAIDGLEGFSLRSYQVDAIKYWRQNGYRGIWAMATGTGKTLTALAAIQVLVQSEGLSALLIVVVVPSTVLVEQWASQLGPLCERVTKVTGSQSTWIGDVSRSLRVVKNRPCIIAVVSTARSFVKEIARRLESVNTKTLLIVDEVHTIGTEAGIRSLSEQISWRLGLSATPLRQYDEEGTESLLDYFGCSTRNYFSYSIKQAVRDGYLCQYRYVPVTVSLTESETDEYAALSERIARMIESDEPDVQKACNQLLIKRHRIVERAENKLSPTVEIIRRYSGADFGSCFGILYCPDGDYPIMADDGASNQWIDRLMTEISSMNTRAHRFVQGDSLELLNDFASGRLDWLVAKKRLDEGVDIPRSQTAVIVASSRTLRQYVQRRGRVLRPHAQKQSATIIDFIVLPAIIRDGVPAFARGLVKQELARASEFVDAATNGPEVSEDVARLAAQFGIKVAELSTLEHETEAIEYLTDEEEA